MYLSYPVMISFPAICWENYHFSFFVQRTKNEFKKLNKLNKTEVACLQNLIHVTFGRDEEVISCK